MHHELFFTMELLKYSPTLSHHRISVGCGIISAIHTPSSPLSFGNAMLAPIIILLHKLNKILKQKITKH